MEEARRTRATDSPWEVEVSLFREVHRRLRLSTRTSVPNALRSIAMKFGTELIRGVPGFRGKSCRFQHHECHVL